MSIDKLVGANRVDGKTQISIISLSHITDFEDQSFVVAQVAFAINAWMRKQGSAPGGNRPRLLFFLDEIGGGGGKTAFYPTYPYTSTCKPALNILVKQGRAFGVGCILATQNPGDIDYKGLSNCATWIVGKLQTKRDRDKIQEGLTDAEFSPSDLGKKLARPNTGEFMLLNKDGDVHFIKERWLLTYHCTLSPEQLRRYKAKGLAPFEGLLNTDIAVPQYTETDMSEEQGEIEALWNDAKDAIGQACNLLEKVTELDGSAEKARVWISILRDPEAIHRRLQEVQKLQIETKNILYAHESSQSPSPSNLMSLLSKSKPVGQNGSASDLHQQSFQKPLTSGSNSVAVEDDGSIMYKGNKYQLYRRYAGKIVTFIEDDKILKFSIEGKVLSKSFQLK